jgi:hypothetical protein
MAPLYIFQSETGDHIERFFHMADAPKFGTVVEEGGVAYKRVPVPPQVDVRKLGKGDHGCVSHGLPLWDKAAPRHTAHGKPAFESQREIKEYEAKVDRDFFWD